MTTTNIFSGIEGAGRTSSKVLRPPGGGSSNIFGPEDEITEIPNGASSPESSPTKCSPTKSLDDSQNKLFGSPDSTDGSRRKSIDRMKSNVFDTSPVSQTKSPRSKVNSRNPITGLTTCEEVKMNGHKQNGTNGYNPLTGDGAEIDQTNTAIKMHNPPGGRSQVQFF